MADWGDAETSFALTFAAAVVTFVAGYIVLVCGVTNELIIIRRLRSCIHAVGWLLMALYIGLLYFDLVQQPRVVWPHLGVVRPIVCVVLGMFYFFTTTHPAFRWISLALLSMTIIWNTMTSASLRIVISCRANSTCTNQAMFSLLALELQWLRNLVDMFAATVAMLLVCGLSVAMGWCHSRYPPRLFDSDVPMSFVPTSSGGNPSLVMGMTAGMTAGRAAYERLAAQNEAASLATTSRGALSTGTAGASVQASRRRKTPAATVSRRTDQSGSGSSAPRSRPSPVDVRAGVTIRHRG